MKTKLFLLVAILNFSIVSAQTFTENGVKYTVIPTTTNVQVVANTPKYTGAVTIPESVIYNSVNYSVTSIGDRAFYNCTGLTAVTIPSSVTSFEFGAFSHCSGLTSVIIPNAVTSIGEAVFAGCFGLTSVTIPNSVTSIGSFAFDGCYGLSSVTIPNSVTSIGIFSFQNCTGLTSVIIPNSVISIDQYAFSGCTSLTTVNCQIATPLVINTDVFENVNMATCVLNVPTASVSLYQAADVWKDFSAINVLNTDSFINENKIKLYPNPVQNELFLDLNNTSKVNLEVADINGKVLITKTINNITNSINTSSLATGLYFLNIDSEEGNSQTIKFIKN